MEKHSSLYRWIWYRPLFRNLRPRLMTMVLALVLPVSLVCLALSAVSVYRSRETSYAMNQNAFSFYMDQLAKLEAAGTAEGADGKCEVLPGKTSGAGQENSGTGTGTSTSAISYAEQKAQEAARRKLEKEVSRLEAKITELEEKKSEWENKMADPAVYSNGEKAKAVQREIEALAAQIDETTAAWEEAAERLG